MLEAAEVKIGRRYVFLPRLNPHDSDLHPSVVLMFMTSERSVKTHHCAMIFPGYAQ